MGVGNIQGIRENNSSAADPVDCLSNDGEFPLHFDDPDAPGGVCNQLPDAIVGQTAPYGMSDLHKQ